VEESQEGDSEAEMGHGAEKGLEIHSRERGIEILDPAGVHCHHEGKHRESRQMAFCAPGPAQCAEDYEMNREGEEEEEIHVGVECLGK
jgi:hypothetical protein